MRARSVRFSPLWISLFAAAALVGACDDGGEDPGPTDMVDTVDTSMPDTSMPDTSMPDTSMPDTSMPDTTEPQDTTDTTGDTSPDVEPDMMMGAAGTCADPIVVDSTGFVLSGTNFATDFGDAIELSDASCALGDGAGGANPDVILSIDLTAGDTLAVAELGGMDSVRNVLVGFCDDNSLCAANLDDPEDEALLYTATADETVWVQVSAYGDTVVPADYYIRVDINPECGNGITEATETCDDGNADANDGCEACELVGPFECDVTQEPTVCTGFPDLGSYGVNQTVPTETGGPLAAGEFEFYRIEFTERVAFSGSLSSDSGDMDFYLWDYDYQEVLVPYLEGNDTWQNEIIEPGLYIIGLNAWEDAGTANTWTLDMSTASIGVCGDGVIEAGETCDDANMVADDGCDACQLRGAFDCDTAASPTTCTPLTSVGMLDVGDMSQFDGGPIVADAVERRALTLNTAMAISGSLTFTTGDADLYIYDEALNTRFAAADIGPETFADVPLPAGTYILEVHAYPDDGNVDRYTLALTTSALTDLGTLDVGGSVMATSTGVLPEFGASGRLLTTAVPLEITGELTGGTTGLPTVDLETADGTFLYSSYVFWGTAGSFTWQVPAGTYLVTVNATNADDATADDVDAWALSLTGATPAPIAGGSFSAGATVGPITGGPVSAGLSQFVEITFDADVVFDGTLTATTGDADLTIRNATTAEPVASAAAVGNETFSVELAAGTYWFEVLAWPQDPAITEFTLQGTTTAAP